MKKSSYGQWMLRAFGVLARLRRLRGSALDVFGYTAERRMERRLLAEYEADLDLIAAELDAGKVEAAVALASVPALIRGFGHVKEANAARAAGERLRLVERFRAGPAPVALEAAE